MDALIVITSIIADIQAISSIYESIQQHRSLPVEFYEVSRNLALAQDTLRLARQQLQGLSLDESSAKALQPTVSDCKEKSKALLSMFEGFEKELAYYHTFLLHLSEADSLIGDFLRDLDALSKLFSYEFTSKDGQKARVDILRTLYTSPYLDGKDRNLGWLPGMCEWFVGHHDFQRWRESKSSSMIWVSASPGSGKSVLAKQLVDSELRTTESRTTCYFFFRYGFEDQRSAKSALSCILHQLFTQRQDLFSDEIVKRLEVYRSDFTSSFYELWEILVMASQDKNAGELVCILDAFDECEDQERLEIAQALCNFYDMENETKGNASLKFLVTSRSSDKDGRGFQSLNIPELTVIDLNCESDLSVHNQFTIYQITSSIPQTVDAAYEMILSKSKNHEEAKKLLHIIVAAARPLTLAEMNLALALRKNHRSYEDLEVMPETHFRQYVRDLCDLFVTVRDSKIYLVHQTAKEFLVHRDDPNLPRDHDNRLMWTSSLLPQESHRILCHICMWHLLLDEFEIHRLDENLEEDPNGELSHYLRDHVFLDYSATNWAVHFRASDIEEDAVIETLWRLCDANSRRCQTWFRIYWASTQMEFPRNFTSLMIASYFGLEKLAKLLLRMDNVERWHLSAFGALLGFRKRI
ncbi:unnamed protein product [Clonostachys rhizophaga]|uniref:NACHT domain-containing protein n=1 Tax=Clonostachys rhizophaga TaxID=160324 RepID=A0A9N9YRK3_9HYPO|nr:unnamed protein product [Clonostachys rhizophaga]